MDRVTCTRTRWNRTAAIRTVSVLAQRDTVVSGMYPSECKSDLALTRPPNCSSQGLYHRTSLHKRHTQRGTSPGSPPTFPNFLKGRLHCRPDGAIRAECLILLYILRMETRERRGLIAKLPLNPDSVFISSSFPSLNSSASGGGGGRSFRVSFCPAGEGERHD